jgi:hypothetical protein
MALIGTGRWGFDLAICGMKISEILNNAQDDPQANQLDVSS